MLLAKRFVKRRRFFALGCLLALAAAALGVGWPTSAHAFGCGVEAEYYSDATYTTLVGIRSRWSEACGCQYFSWGVQTAYRIWVEPSC